MSFSTACMFGALKREMSFLNNLFYKIKISLPELSVLDMLGIPEENTWQSF